MDANYYINYWNLGLALVGQGRYHEAVEACRRATLLAPGDTLPQAHLGWAFGLAGQSQEALTILADLERRRTQEYVAGFFLALVNLGLGDNDRTITWLQQSAEERDGLMTWLNTLFVFDPLRSDLRFQDLLRRMNFPETAARPSTQ